MCCSVIALVACEPDNPGGGNADVPVAEGKVTIYFTMADDSVALPEYASVFFAGGQTGWKTGLEAPEFQKVEGKNLYYIQIAYDASVTQAVEYAIVLGYNTSSGLPDAQLGLQWNDDYKSDTCREASFPDNAKFADPAGAQKIDLGTHKFSTEIAAPIRVNTTLRITFEEALPEKAEVYLKGSFTNWDDNNKMVASADRTQYTLALKDVLCTGYQYKILVFKDGTDGLVKKDGDKDLSIWDWRVANPQLPEGVGDAESKLIGYTIISAGENNLSSSVTKADNNTTIELAGTVGDEVKDKDGTVLVAKKGIDLSKAILLEGKDGDKGNNVFTYTCTASNPKKTFVVRFKEALSENAILFMMGEITDPQWNNDNDQSKMTIAEDRKSASFVAEVLPGVYQYKIVVFHKDSYKGNVWDGGVEINDNSQNLKITVVGLSDGEVELFAEPIDAPVIDVASPSADVTFKITFTDDMTGKIVKVKGPAVGGWGTELTMTSTDGKTFTVKVEKGNLKVGEGEFIVGVGVDGTEDFYADGHKVAGSGEWGGANAKVTIPAAGGEVALFANSIPAAPAA